MDVAPFPTGSDDAYCGPDGWLDDNRVLISCNVPNTRPDPVREGWDYPTDAIDYFVLDTDSGAAEFVVQIPASPDFWNTYILATANETPVFGYGTDPHEGCSMQFTEWDGDSFEELDTLNELVGGWAEGGVDAIQGPVLYFTVADICGDFAPWQPLRYDTATGEALRLFPVPNLDGNSWTWDGPYGANVLVAP